MLKKIMSNPILAAVLFFIAIWAAFPLVALARSFVSDISFAQAACSPFLILIFAGGSVAYAVPAYLTAKRSAK